MAVIETPITTTKVANTLGVSSRDVGTLCTSNRINKWAKYKPVCYYNTVVGDPDIICKAKYNNADGTGVYGAHSNGDYGIAPGYMENRDYSNTGDQIKEACNFDWEYQPPTGTSRFPYRLGDFRGYDTSAQPFLTLGEVEGASWDGDRDRYNVNPLVHDEITFYFNYHSKDDYPSWVCADDLVSLAELDFTKAFIICAIYHHTSPSDQLVTIVSTLDTMGEDGPENGWIVDPSSGYPNYLRITVKTSEFDLQSTNYVYFAIAYRRDDGINRIASLPYPTGTGAQSFPLTLYIQENAAEAGLAIDRTTARISYNFVNSTSAANNSRLLTDVIEGGSYRILCSGRLSFRFTFRNTSNTSRTFRVGYFRLVDWSNWSNRLTVQQVWSETQGTLTEFTVPANGDITVWIPFEGELVNPPTSAVNYSIELGLVYDDAWSLWYDTIQMGYGNGFETI